MIRSLACLPFMVVGLVSSAALAAPPAAPLGAPKYTRSRALITKLDWEKVAPGADKVGIGGADAPLRVEGCGDDPGGAPVAAVGQAVADQASGLQVTIVKAEPAGKSGRGWLGNQCRFRVGDARQADRFIELDAPAFNTITAVAHDGDEVYVAIGFNGYAKEINGRGNYLVVADLASHKVKWRSADLSANGAFLVTEDHVVVGYGFTKEKASLTVLDCKTGTVVQTQDLPKKPDALRLAGGKLYVRIYDGYAVLPWCPGGGCK